MENSDNTSAYGYRLNNPIKLIDTDGRKILDINGNVIYTHEKGWSTNAPKDAIRLGNAMMLTNRGKTQFNSMVDAKHSITLSISPENKFEERINGTEYIYGRAIKKTTSVGELLSVDIIVYEGTLKAILRGGKSVKAKSYQSAVSNIDEAIGAVGTHESVHAVSEKNIQRSIANRLKDTKYDVEEIPEKAENECLNELIRKKYSECEKYRNITNFPNIGM